MLNDKIIICTCSSRSIIDKERAARLASQFKTLGSEVLIIPDLCKSIQNKDSLLDTIPNSVVVACYPRAVESLLAWRGVESKQNIDLRNGSVEEIVSQLSNKAEEPEELAAITEQLNALPVEDGNDAWFPIIDKARCTNCRKCHDFCLFGVYSVEEKQVKVVNPQGCKNNCPACARVCPSRAIIFPKYDKSPINGGEAQEEEFDAESIDKMYNERLKYRLQQRRASVSLLKPRPKNDI